MGSPFLRRVIWTSRRGGFISVAKTSSQSDKAVFSQGPSVAMGKFAAAMPVDVTKTIASFFGWPDFSGAAFAVVATALLAALGAGVIPEGDAHPPTSNTPAHTSETRATASRMG